MDINKNSTQLYVTLTYNLFKVLGTLAFSHIKKGYLIILLSVYPHLIKF